MQAERSLLAERLAPGTGPEPEWPLLARQVLPGRQHAVRPALSRLEQALDPLRLTPEAAAEAQLVIAEVLNNIVKHAYLAGHGEIAIELRLAGTCLACTFRDSGAAMPDGVLPSAQTSPLDVSVEDLPEGGFGWLLIRSMVRDLAYRREPGLNHLFFLLPLERS